MEAFFIGPGSRKYKSVKFASLRQELERVVWPGIAFRCSWWPLKIEILKDMEKLEREMLAGLLRMYPEPGEEAGEFNRRKHKAIGKLIPGEKSWAAKICKHNLSYDKHVKRNHSEAWCAHTRSAVPNFPSS